MDSFSQGACCTCPCTVPGHAPPQASTSGDERETASRLLTCKERKRKPMRVSSLLGGPAGGVRMLMGPGKDLMPTYAGSTPIVTQTGFHVRI